MLQRCSGRKVTVIFSVLHTKKRKERKGKGKRKEGQVEKGWGWGGRPQLRRGGGGAGGEVRGNCRDTPCLPLVVKQETALQTLPSSLWTVFTEQGQDCCGAVDGQ